MSAASNHRCSAMSGLDSAFRARPCDTSRWKRRSGSSGSRSNAVQSRLKVFDGVLEGGTLQRFATSLSGTSHDRRRVTGVSTQSVVPGDLRPTRRCGVSFQLLADAPVQLRRSRPRELSQDGVASERVDERPPTGIQLCDESCCLRLLERVHREIRADVEDASDDPLVELQADDGPHCHDPASRCGQSRHPPQDHVSNTAWYPDIVERSARHPGAVWLLERSSLGEIGDQRQ